MVKLLQRLGSLNWSLMAILIAVGVFWWGIDRLCVSFIDAFIHAFTSMD